MWRIISVPVRMRRHCRRNPEASRHNLSLQFLTGIWNHRPDHIGLLTRIRIPEGLQLRHFRQKTCRAEVVGSFRRKLIRTSLLLPVTVFTVSQEAQPEATIRTQLPTHPPKFTAVVDTRPEVPPEPSRLHLKRHPGQLTTTVSRKPQVTYWEVKPEVMYLEVKPEVMDSEVKPEVVVWEAKAEMANAE